MSLALLTEPQQMRHETPVFLNRAEVASLLRLSPRQVDRLAAPGTLVKQKLSVSRSGFHLYGVSAYLHP